MLEIAEARETVLRLGRKLRPESVLLPAITPGQILAEEIRSEGDSPPFTKSLRDGFAVRSADFTKGVAELKIIETIAAGETPTKKLAAGQAAELYTGAPVPAGADAVVMQEQAEFLEGGRVRLVEPNIAPGLWILPQATEMRAGESILAAGAPLDPAVCGLLATMGRPRVLVYPRPRVGVLSTGNELVPADTEPGPGQIRNSNGPMLMAQVMRAGAAARSLGLVKDERSPLKLAIRNALASSDVLVISGGVSAGKYDLVPSMLEKIGVQIHFHQVRMKPGKPLLFGIKRDTFVFGLPGNPVSSFVCFEVFVRPLLRMLAGLPEVPATRSLPLTAPLKTSNDRPTFHPAKVVPHGDSLTLEPVDWFGSADLRALRGVGAFIQLPEGDVKLAAGDMVEALVIESKPIG